MSQPFRKKPPREWRGETTGVTVQGAMYEQIGAVTCPDRGCENWGLATKDEGRVRLDRSAFQPYEAERGDGAHKCNSCHAVFVVQHGRLRGVRVRKLSAREWERHEEARVDRQIANQQRHIEAEGRGHAERVDREPTECPVCGKEFPSVAYAERHAARQH